MKVAFEHSLSGRVIVEEFIEKQGCSSDSDCFSVDGRLKFVSFSAQRFDEDAPNPYTPSAFSWPSTFTKEQEAELTSEIQRLLTLLGMRTSIYNIETRVGVNGKPYIMEVSPRGGGNRLAEMVRFATGVDLITNAVRAAVGEEVVNVEQKPYDGHWAEVVLHTNKPGFFQGIKVSSRIKDKIVDLNLWVGTGEAVSSFSGANNTIGTMIFRFKSEEELKDFVQNYRCEIEILIKH